MGTRVLIDSNIVIDMLAGVAAAFDEVHKHQDRAISIITWIEVVAGFRENELALREVLRSSFIVVPLTADIAEEAAVLRRRTKLKLPDSVILATAHIEKRVLVTRNSRDFKPGRFITIPYQL